VGVASPYDGKILFLHLLLYTLAKKNDHMELMKGSNQMVTELELPYEVTAA
jgi:hypothetical protein